MKNFIDTIKDFCISATIELKNATQKLSHTLSKSFIRFVKNLREKTDSLIKRGGIKAKLIGFITVVILATVTVLSIFSLSVMQDSIEKKAFEVAASTLSRISDLSFTPLLERSYEHKINLEAALKELQDSKVEGVLSAAVYARRKIQSHFEYNFFAGFEDSDKSDLNDSVLIATINEHMSGAILRDSVLFGDVETYRFVKPIIYNFKGEKLLTGIVQLYYDKEAISGTVRKTVYTILSLTSAIIILVIGAVYILGEKFTRPVLAIANAATDVFKGNLNVRLDISTNDEIEELAERFNDMVTGLREREKMQKFVSTSTIGMIKNNSYSMLSLGGEYRELTFLFSDIRNFTAMSEAKKPDQVVEIINFYLNLQSEIIKEFGGDIDKFIGDEIMVVFHGENAIDQAISCAVAIQQKILEENQNRKNDDHTLCEVGIGISSGEVIVGNIGSKERMDFTSIGSSVNLGARLCSQAQPSQILIPKDSYDKCQNKYDAVLHTLKEVKGFKSPIEAYCIKIGAEK